MTSRTHDLAAFTALAVYVAYNPPIQMTLATAFVAVAANMLGAATPDIDQPTAKLWFRIPIGSLFGRIIGPMLGNHRMISHSIVGVLLAGWLMKLLLGYTQKFLLIDGGVVFWAFILGYVSHLVMDTVTKDGVPWLFPIPIRIGFPPFRFMRLSTGGIAEKSLVFPGLMFFNGYIFYQNYRKFIDFVSNYITR